MNISKKNIISEDDFNIELKLKGIRYIKTELFDHVVVSVVDENRTLKGIIEYIRRDQNCDGWVSIFTLRKTNDSFMPFPFKSDCEVFNLPS